MSNISVEMSVARIGTKGNSLTMVSVTAPVPEPTSRTNDGASSGYSAVEDVAWFPGDELEVERNGKCSFATSTSREAARKEERPTFEE
jgi:hypothetical protein